MGMFKDMRDLSKAGKQMKKERGGSLQMMKDGLAQMQATGKNVNMQPELQFQLTVDVNGSQSDVTHTQVVSPAVIGQLQPGAQIPIKVDPNDHSQLMIGL
jgi:hypothetical protein